MVTRRKAMQQLLGAAVVQLDGADWAIAGGNRLRAKLDGDVEGIILPLAAGYVDFTVSISLGPRFPSVERIVAKASRAAGQQQSGIRSAAVFPTVFERLAAIAPVPDHTPITDTDAIIEALRLHAVPFMRRLSTAASAADYALAAPLAYGAHAVRIPVLLAKAGRRKEAQEYLDRQTDPAAPYPEFMSRYRAAVLPLL